MKYSKEFFNETYTGMDKRLNQVLYAIDSSLEEWVARDVVQRQLKVSLNTIKSWVSTLEAEGLVEWIKGVDLNARMENRVYDGNKIYIKRCQKGVKKLLIRCEENELKKLLENIKVSIGDTFFQDLRVKSKVSRCQQDTDTLKKEQKIVKNEEIDTFSLTPLKNKDEN